MPFKKGHKGYKKGKKHKKTIEQEKALEFVQEKIRKEFEGLIDTQIGMAKGIYVFVKEPITGKLTKKVYKKPPNKDVLESLVNRVVGKPREMVEHTGTIKTLIIDI